MKLANTMTNMGLAARASSAVLRSAPAAQRTHAIEAIARNLRSSSRAILAANAKDVALADTMVDRLLLNTDRVEEMAVGIDAIAKLSDPVAEVMDSWTRPNGLEIKRVRTPIGVIAMIYESRPNVTADAAAIAIRSGNAIILRSGSAALRSALAIHTAIVAGIEEAGLPRNCVQLVPTESRLAVGQMLGGLEGSIDLIIPRGGRALVDRVCREARVAVLGHLEGVCHTYVHASADPEMAAQVVANAKMRRVSVCGATESLLIDRKAARALLPAIARALAGCELRGDGEARAIVMMKPASESDWSFEYLAPVLSVRIVTGIDEAIEHIHQYGSGHTEAIVAEDKLAAERFLREVDSAIVMWNASTQFADGGEFGFGAEIGIATGRLHARGPIGPEQLTTFKYEIRGSGQVRT